VIGMAASLVLEQEVRDDDAFDPTPKSDENDRCPGSKPEKGPIHWNSFEPVASNSSRVVMSERGI